MIGWFRHWLNTKKEDVRPDVHTAIADAHASLDRMETITRQRRREAAQTRVEQRQIRADPAMLVRVFDRHYPNQEAP